jgi:hypothetical protein
LECYHVFRNRIEHEDNLIMQRLSWLMASQSFLFTAYAIVSNALTTASANNANIHLGHLTTLSHIVPVVALLNSFLIFVSILAALRAIRELRKGYARQPVHLEAINLQTSRLVRWSGLSAPVLLPLMFLAVWIFLLAK